MTTSELLTRKADEYDAIREEHATEGDNRWQVAIVIATVLRELAAALEAEREAA